MNKRHAGVLSLLVLVAILAACQRAKPERVVVDAAGSLASASLQFELHQAPAQATERVEGKSFVVRQENCADAAPLETAHRETVELGPAYELGKAEGIPDLAPYQTPIGQIVLRRYQVAGETSSSGEVTLRTAGQARSEYVLRWDETWDRNSVDIIRQGQVIGSAPLRVRLGAQLVLVSSREEPCVAPTAGTPGKAHLPIVGSAPITTTTTPAAPSGAMTHVPAESSATPIPLLGASAPATAMPSRTRRATPSLTATPTATVTPAYTPTQTRRPTRTLRPSRTPRPTRTLRPSFTPWPTRTLRPTRTPTSTRTAPPSHTPTRMPSRTSIPSRTFTPWPTFTPTRVSPMVSTATDLPGVIVFPTATETAEPSATVDGVLPQPGSEEAIALVRDYIQFLQARQWRDAYNLLDDTYQRRMSYNSFVKGYEGVVEIELYGLECTWVDEQRESVRAIMNIRTVAGPGDWMGTYEVVQAPGKLPYERRISSIWLARLPDEDEARLGKGVFAVAQPLADR